MTCLFRGLVIRGLVIRGLMTLFLISFDLLWNFQVVMYGCESWTIKKAEC